MRKFVIVKFFVLSCCLFQLVYAYAPTGRYTDENGQPLSSNSQQVKDIVTSLIWQRGDSNGTQSWSSSAAAGSAQAYCAALVIGDQGAGSWRLPRNKELRTLVDMSSSNPAIDTNAFPNTPSSRFWSSTVALVGSGEAWVVFFDFGEVSHEGISTNYSVRCVR